MVLNSGAVAADARPVLLLRGLLRERRHWLDFPQRLSLQLQRPVLTLDLAGCGVLNQQQSASSIAGLRAQLQQQWRLSYPEYQHLAVDLVAISMGAMVALDWAVAEPQQISSVALVNSSSGLNRFWQRLRPANYLNMLLCLSAGASYRERLIWQMTVNSPLDQQLLELWQQWALQYPIRRTNALRQLWAASRFRLTAAPSCPLLVLCSSADRLVSAQCSRDLAEALQAPLQMHATAGHDLPLDAADWLIKHLTDFVLHCSKSESTC